MIRLKRRTQFTQPMDTLRQTCYPGAYPSGASKDRFDDRAVHVTAQMDGEFAAYVRLVPGPNGYFEWTRRGQADIPRGSNVVDLTRGAVTPAFRGWSFFELVLIEGLLYADEHDFSYAMGSAKVGRGFLPMLVELGFQRSGPPVQAYFTNGDAYLTNGNAYLGQCFAVDMRGWKADWLRRKHELLRPLIASEKPVTGDGEQVE